MEIQNEIWKDVPGYPDYKVSNLGKVKSLKKGIERFLNLNLGSHGYLRVNLFRDNVGKNFKVHQLVAITFLGHEINGHNRIIDHINSDKLDNRAENLRIVTARENCSKLSEKKKKISKYIGVSKDIYSRWESYIRIKNKLYKLGIFETEDEAREAYLKAVNRLEKGIYPENYKTKTRSGTVDNNS